MQWLKCAAGVGFDRSGVTLPASESMIRTWSSDWPPTSSSYVFTSCLFLSHRLINQLLPPLAPLTFLAKAGWRNFFFLFSLTTLIVQVCLFVPVRPGFSYKSLFWCDRGVEGLSVIGKLLWLTQSHKLQVMTHGNTVHSGQQRQMATWVRVSVAVFAYTLTFICIRVLLRRGFMTHHLRTF